MMVAMIMLIILCQKCDDPNSLRFPAGFLLIIQCKGATAREQMILFEKKSTALNNALNE